MAETTASCGSLQSVKKSIVRCVTGELYNLFLSLCLLLQWVDFNEK